MKQKLSFLLTGILFVCFSLLWTACDENDENSLVNIDMQKTGNIQFSLSKTTLVDDVSKVTAILTKTGYSAIKQDLVITGKTASGRIDDIPAGTWQLLVEAKDTNEVVLYRGKADVEIIGGKITYVNIHLAVVSSVGNMVINVTWDQTLGINWTKHPGNPVLTSDPVGIWDSAFTTLATVIHDGINYKMWYSGHNGTSYRIGLATSSDGVNWTKYSGNPVLDTGGAGEWDSSNVFFPNVIFDGTEYKMWYGGNTKIDELEVGYATSPDGINWTKYSGNPVLKSGAEGTWDDLAIISPSVIYDGQIYKMWYSGDPGNSERQIGYATSPDGVNWEKYPGNPVMSQTADAWDSFSVDGPSVIFDGIKYKMWYDGSNLINRRIGYATSPDGVTWTKYSGNPVLDIGGAGEWDSKSINYPMVLFDQNKYKIWYTGYDLQGYAIGYATSP